MCITHIFKNSIPYLYFLILHGILPSFFLYFGYVFGQTTTVSGKITDANTNVPLPFVNVTFRNSKIGTTTNLDGKYSLESYYATDSLVASFLGYKKMSKKVKKDVMQEINFELQPTTIELKAVEILGDKKQENPAHPILRNVMNNKKINNREKLEAYQYEAYNKVEFDLNNIDDEFKKRKVMKPFSFIFQYIDSSEKKPFVPIFITETSSEIYFRRDDGGKKEVVKGTRISGIKNESVSQFLGDMYQNFNIYDNYFTIFNKSFASPISDFWQLTYNYYLVDSVLIENNWCYKLHFKPKLKQGLAFTGDMWIHDTTYAVKRIEMSVSKEANINFVHEFRVAQQYTQVEKEVWMLTKDFLFVDFSLTNTTTGVYGSKTSSYRNFLINKPKESGFFSATTNITIEDSAMERSEDFWQEHRHEKLTTKEQRIYGMVDTIKNIPAFRTIIDVIHTFLYGYMPQGKVEIGPYFTLFSFNPVEGARFRVGIRTNHKFSKRLRPEVYLAYGTKDNRFKYGTSLLYTISQKPLQKVTLSYKHDVQQLGQEQTAWRHDNFLSSILRRNPAIKLSGFNELTCLYQYEFFQGLTAEPSLSQKRIYSISDSLRFERQNNGSGPAVSEEVHTSEVGISVRFAYNEKFVLGKFDRVSLGTKFPIIRINYTKGFSGILKSQYDYHKLKININDKWRFGPFGWSRVIVEGGKIFGEVPFVLQEIHNGNETWQYDMSAYNLMNFYEFVSDEYVSLFITHHFNGYFLNRIPLMHKLKWRETAFIKGVLGRLNYDSRNLLSFPWAMGTLNKGPYYEAGVGVENILKVLRVDALWRLSYLSYPDNEEKNKNISLFGVRATLYISF